MNPIATIEDFELIVNTIISPEKFDKATIHASYVIYRMFMERVNTMPEMNDKVDLIGGVKCFVKTIIDHGEELIK